MGTTRKVDRPVAKKLHLIALKVFGAEAGPKVILTKQASANISSRCIYVLRSTHRIGSLRSIRQIIQPLASIKHRAHNVGQRVGLGGKLCVHNKRLFRMVLPNVLGG